MKPWETMSETPVATTGPKNFTRQNLEDEN